MKLGIIIPTYNSLSTLKVLVRQIHKYTDGDYQLYLIEDGQEAKTLAWLHKRKPKHTTILYHRDNQGIAQSWNDGLSLALEDNCTHIAFINDDVEVPEGWWMDICGLFRNNTIHMVCLDAPCPIPLTGWFFIIDTYCVETIGLFDSRMTIFAQDQDYWYRYKARGLKIAKADVDVYHHGSHTLQTLDPLKMQDLRRQEWNLLRQKHPNITMQSL